MERHQLFDIAMRGDYAVRHIIRMAGRVTDAFKADEPVQSADEAVQALRPSRFVLALPSVHILTQQGDFDYAAVDERLCLVHDRCPGAADFRPARIGHDAISAEFVAAFLNRQESGGALLYGAAGKGTEFGSSGHVSVERGFRSEEHTSELQSLMRISYAVFCL